MSTEVNKRIISEQVRPKPHPFYGDSYERGLDPFHRDAFDGFPDAFKDAAPRQETERRAGWYLIDGCGNVIGWVPDGSEEDAAPGMESLMISGPVPTYINPERKAITDMELTEQHYELAKVAYDGYCKQTGGKSLATGDILPSFENLRGEIRNAWAAAAIAVSLKLDMDARKA